MTDGDKIAAAILVAKASTPDTGLEGLLEILFDTFDKMEKREDERKNTRIASGGK
jgi:hypothetical protein